MVAAFDAGRSVASTLEERCARPCASIAGEADGAALWEFHAFNLDQLRRDALVATCGYDWRRGMFGHSLPLTISKLSDYGANHYNNRVEGDFEEPLERCPYFAEIFHAFRCEIASFRLLWRPGHSGYTLHSDRDVGERTFRLQIPIFTNDRVLVMASSVDDASQFVCNHPDLATTKNWLREGISVAQMEEWVTEFITTNVDRVRCYRLEPGRLYYFDTSKFHNLWNFGEEERLTLAIDVVANDWLEEHFPEITRASCRGPAPRK